MLHHHALTQPMRSDNKTMRPVASMQNCPLCAGHATTAFCSVQERHYWRCDDCALRFLQADQLPAPDEELAHYRLHNNDVNDAGYRGFLARLAEPLLQLLPPAQRGLDYGCGPGPALAQMLRAAGHDVAVFDPLFANEPELLQQQYDFITCTETVEHFHHPVTEFQRLIDMLNPGGWLALMTTLQDNDKHFADWHYRRDPTHVCFYRQETMRWLADAFDLSMRQPSRNVILLQQR